MRNDTPQGYSGPSLEILIRDMKAEPIPDFVKRVLTKVPASVTKFGSFQKDKIDGELTKTLFQYLEEERKPTATIIEMADFIQNVARVKLDCEQKNMRIAGKFTEWTFKSIADEVENIIEDDKKVKHSYI